MGKALRFIMVIIIVCMYSAVFAGGTSLNGPVNIIGSDKSMYIPSTPTVESPTNFLTKSASNQVGSALISSILEWNLIAHKPTTFPPEAHNHAITDVINLQTSLNSKVTKNADITGATKTKITYDSKGLVTAGADLTAVDIPILEISKINGLQTALNSKENSLGNPESNGQILSSTTAGIRSWINQYTHPTVGAISQTLTGSQVFSLLATNTGGHVTGSGYRNLTLSDLGYTGDNNANYYVHPTQTAINPTLTGANVLASLSINTLGHTTAATTRTLTKSDIGLGNVDNTSDINKPISTATQTALNGKENTIGNPSVNGYIPSRSTAGVWTWVPQYVHPTGDGNLHVPVTGTTNNKKVLTAGSTAGSLSWSFVDWTDLLSKPSSFTPAAHTLVSHTDWTTYFDGQALKSTSIPTFAGGIFNGPTENVIGTTNRHYGNVYHFWTNTASYTGTCKIVLPKSWSATMLIFKITGYNYNSIGAWECIIGGYNYDSSPNWYNTSAEIRGSAPFSQVRLAHDGTKCILLLGTTTTVWNYPQIEISDVYAGFSGQSGWKSPYALSFISSESGITNIATPIVNSGIAADWNALINKPTGTTNYITMFTNGATGAIGNSQMSQSTNEVSASKGFTSTDYLQSLGPLYIRNNIGVLNYNGSAWLNFATRAVNGTDTRYNLDYVGSIIGSGVWTITDGSSALVFSNSSGTGRAQIQAQTASFFLSTYTASLGAHDNITMYRDAGMLGSGKTLTTVNGVLEVEDYATFGANMFVAGNSTVSGTTNIGSALRYSNTYEFNVAGTQNIDVTGYPLVLLTATTGGVYTLTGGTSNSRVTVANTSTTVHSVNGVTLYNGGGVFVDFLKIGTVWYREY